MGDIINSGDILELLKRNSEVITKMMEEQERLIERVTDLEPRAKAFDTITAAGRGFTASDAADILTRRTGYEVGRNKLFEYLRATRIMMPDRNHVYQEYETAGYFENNLIEGGPALRHSIKVTTVGLEYIGKRIAKNPHGLKLSKKNRGLLE